MKYLDPDKVVPIAFLTIFISFIIAILVFYGWVFVEYGDKPITEVPAWVILVMQPQR